MRAQPDEPGAARIRSCHGSPAVEWMPTLSAKSPRAAQSLEPTCIYQVCPSVCSRGNNQVDLDPASWEGFHELKRIVAKFLPEKAASFLCDQLEHDPDGILFSSSFDKVGERQAMVLNRF